LRIGVQRELAPIKSGWSSRSHCLRLATHGRTQAIADANLQRTLRRFFTALSRGKALQATVDQIGLEITDEHTRGIDVVLTAPTATSGGG
jgi:hypothetical protein